MERKQIYLATDQVEELDRIARDRDVPVSLLIREAISRYLVTLEEPPLERVEEHPLWSIVGIVGEKDAPANGAASHDQTLYKVRRHRR